MHLYFMLIILQYIWEGKIMWLVSLTSAAALLSKMQRLTRSVCEGSFHHMILLALLAQRPEVGVISEYIYFCMHELFHIQWEI